MRRDSEVNRLLGSGAPGVGWRLEMRIQEAMDGEEMEQRKRERGHQWQQLGQWSLPQGQEEGGDV